VVLTRGETKPDRAHHDAESKIHHNTYRVGDNITVALDEITMEEHERYSQRIRSRMYVICILHAANVFLNLAVDTSGERRLLPSILYAIKTLLGIGTVFGEVGVD
jgi:hypothetical protein